MNTSIIVHIITCKYIYNCIYFHLLLNKGLINVYTIKPIKHENDKPHGVVSNNLGSII